MDALRSLSAKACLKMNTKIIIFLFDEKVSCYVVSFEKIPNCPKENRELPFSKKLQDILLGISRATRIKYLHISSTPENQKIASGSSLQSNEIHIDRRRKNNQVYPPSNFIWVLIHEIIHFYEPWKRLKWIPDEKNHDKDNKEKNDGEQKIQSIIGLTNDVRNELGEKCYRHPDHGLEVFVCENPDGSWKAVELDATGKIKREAPLDSGDPNPIIPFTGGQRAAGPGTI